MLCRRILGCVTKESSDRCLERIAELDKEGIVSKNHFIDINMVVIAYLTDDTKPSFPSELSPFLLCVA